jgi:hypothetical protein
MEGAREPPEPPRGRIFALFPDCERPFLPGLDAVSAQLPFADPSSWLAYDRPSPRSRCWIDVPEKPELYPDAIGLHLVASGRVRITYHAGNKG